MILMMIKNACIFLTIVVSLIIIAAMSFVKPSEKRTRK
ncbi:hypothetical protein UF69_1443 [Staphylococcus haemolyticus]|nr:hypothetical protein UF69_1443 [Staphylococcus haemolyticus]